MYNKHDLTEGELVTMTSEELVALFRSMRSEFRQSQALQGELEAEAVAANEKVEILSSKSAALAAKNKEFKVATTDLEKQLRDASEAWDKAVAAEKQAKSINATQMAEIKQLRAAAKQVVQASATDESGSEQQAEIERLSAALEAARNTIAESEARAEESQSQVAALSAEVQKFQAERQKYEGRITVLTDQVDEGLEAAQRIIAEQPADSGNESDASLAAELLEVEAKEGQDKLEPETVALMNRVAELEKQLAESQTENAALVQLVVDSSSREDALGEDNNSLLELLMKSDAERNEFYDKSFFAKIWLILKSKWTGTPVFEPLNLNQFIDPSQMAMLRQNAPALPTDAMATPPRGETKTVQGNTVTGRK